MPDPFSSAESLCWYSGHHNRRKAKWKPMHLFIVPMVQHHDIPEFNGKPSIDRAHFTSNVLCPYLCVCCNSTLPTLGFQALTLLLSNTFCLITFTVAEIFGALITVHAGWPVPLGGWSGGPLQPVVEWPVVWAANRWQWETCTWILQFSRAF